MKLTDANRLKFRPDGKVLILDGGSGILVVLDAASRKEIKRLKVAFGDSGDGGIFVMPDGSRAYLGLSDDHSVVVIDLLMQPGPEPAPMAKRFSISGGAAITRFRHEPLPAQTHVYLTGRPSGGIYCPSRRRFHLPERRTL